MKRVFLIVLDSLGIGQMPDSEKFGDVGVNTLAACAATGNLHIPNLIKAGLGNIDGVTCLPKSDAPTAAVARLAESSAGKDTTIGHWEIAGIISDDPLPTYPDGFPEEILAPFRKKTGRGVLANAPWSGTAVIEQYGAEHMRTGDLIVYTSADSVFQIAAHEEIVPPEQLYEYCRIARRLLQGKQAWAGSSPVPLSVSRGTLPVPPTATIFPWSHPGKPSWTQSKKPVLPPSAWARFTIFLPAVASANMYIIRAMPTV